MKKFSNPKAELLELDLADVICSSFEEPLQPDPNGATGEVPGPAEGTGPDGENEF